MDLTDWIPDTRTATDSVADRVSASANLRPSHGVPRSEQDLAHWLAAGPALIQGDNLPALERLDHLGYPRPHLIYIDPPYNTGNTFAYHDNLRSGAVAGRAGGLTPQARELARRHGGWVAMMRPRLEAGARLLDPTGVLYASIDHNSAHVLRLLLDEVFGPENFVAELAVSLNPKGRQLGPFFATSHEYLLVYAKDVKQCLLDPSTTEHVRLSDFPHEDSRGRYRLLPLRNTNKKFNPDSSPTLYYPLFGDPQTGRVSTTEFPGGQVITPVFGDGRPAVWRWSPAKVLADSDQLQARVVKGRLGQRLDVYQKDRWSPTRTKKLNSVWTSNQVGSTDTAVAELKKELGDVFESPKPVGLLRRILTTMPSDARVLDFFAGSGTTAVAVAQQNAADGGSRSCLLIEDVAAPPAGSKAARAGYERVCDVTADRVRACLAALSPDDALRTARLDRSPDRTSEEPTDAVCVPGSVRLAPGAGSPRSGCTPIHPESPSRLRRIS